MEEEVEAEILIRVERRGGRTFVSGTLFSEFARDDGITPLSASDYVVETLEYLLAHKLDEHTKRMRKEVRALKKYVDDITACAVSPELLDIMNGALEAKSAVLEARLRIIVRDMIMEALPKRKRPRIPRRRK